VCSLAREATVQRARPGGGRWGLISHRRAPGWRLQRPSLSAQRGGAGYVQEGNRGLSPESAAPPVCEWPAPGGHQGGRGLLGGPPPQNSAASQGAATCSGAARRPPASRPERRRCRHGGAGRGGQDGDCELRDRRLGQGIVEPRSGGRPQPAWRRSGAATTPSQRVEFPKRFRFTGGRRGGLNQLECPQSGCVQVGGGHRERLQSQRRRLASMVEEQDSRSHVSSGVVVDNRSLSDGQRPGRGRTLAWRTSKGGRRRLLGQHGLGMHGLGGNAGQAAAGKGRRERGSRHGRMTEEQSRDNPGVGARACCGHRVWGCAAARGPNQVGGSGVIEGTFRP